MFGQTGWHAFQDPPLCLDERVGVCFKISLYVRMNGLGCVSRSASVFERMGCHGFQDKPLCLAVRVGMRFKISLCVLMNRFV